MSVLLTLQGFPQEPVQRQRYADLDDALIEARAYQGWKALHLREEGSGWCLACKAAGLGRPLVRHRAPRDH